MVVFLVTAGDVNYALKVCSIAGLWAIGVI